MIRRFRMVAWTALIATFPSAAQSPFPPQPISPPQSPAPQVKPLFVAPSAPVGASPFVSPTAPRTLPPTVGRTAQAEPSPIVNPNNKTGDPRIQLLRNENRLRIDHPTIYLRRQQESWQLWVGRTLLRDFGQNQRAAEEAKQVFHDLKPTEWATIGKARTVVEYGLTNGEAPSWAPNPKVTLRIDLASLRAEELRGVWVLRDDANILLNFGTERTEAEQANLVCRRYGFNRIGIIGFPTPVMTYFYTTAAIAESTPTNDPLAALTLAAQEQQLVRTGIAIAGGGYVGERIRIDTRKLTIRRERGEWILTDGASTIANFGQSDWLARDAKRILEDLRVTEVCRVGSSDTLFFLSNGLPPKRIPFSAQGSRFNPKGLRVMPIQGRFGLFDVGGRMVLPCASKEEGEQLIQVIEKYGFDQHCRVGLSSQSSLKFLAKSER